MPNTINLDALTAADRLPRVVLFGREMTVLPLTGGAAHRLAVVQEQDATGAGMLAALLEVIAAAVPDLTDAERDRLTVDQIAALIQLSRGQVADVEEIIAERQEKN